MRNLLVIASLALSVKKTLDVYNNYKLERYKKYVGCRLAIMTYCKLKVRLNKKGGYKTI